MSQRLAPLALLAFALTASLHSTGCGGSSEPDACRPDAERCNALDDDCDGRVDEDFAALGAACSVGLGECGRTGTTVCNGAGDGTACDAVAGSPTTEVCDGKDNDCDPGTADGTGEASLGGACDGAVDADLCADGLVACESGAMVCVEAGTGKVERCNGADDDCNGTADDGLAGTACCPTGNLADCTSTGGGTRCHPGVEVCVSGAFLCGGAVARSVETCNGIDDDCNGLVDDVPGLDTACSGGTVNTTGACSAAYTCNGGTPGSGPSGLTCTQVVGPTSETCNGLDEDCDGIPDQVRPCYEGPPGTAGVGPCRAGTSTCASGAYGACVGQVLPSQDLCDGVDNDCDSTVDEDYRAGGSVSMTDHDGTAGLHLGDACGAGVCAGGVVVCDDWDATSLTCPTWAERRRPEFCDGKDNDCDGKVDDALNPTPCELTLGVCGGSRHATCAGASGWVACTNADYEVHDPTFEAAIESLCGDGLDNDCDGFADAADPDCSPWSHAIAIDGDNDFTPEERFATTSGGYTGWITWDADNLYVGYQGPDVASASATRWLLVYLGAVGPGTTAGVLYTTQAPLLPFAATHHARLKLDLSYFNLLAFDGTAWSPAAGGTMSYRLAGDFVELRFPLAELGSPATLAVHVSMINEAVGDERTWGGIPSTSFPGDGRDPDYAHFFEFVLAGTDAPASYPVR